MSIENYRDIGEEDVPYEGLAKLLKDYKGKSLFFAIHQLEEDPDEDIMDAVEWIESILEGRVP